MHLLDLPADCLIASDMDSASKTEKRSDFESGFERELNEVHPPPSDFQDVSCNPSMRLTYRDLVPMTRFFSTWLPISEGDQRHHTDFIQRCDIPLPDCKNFKRTEGDTSFKDYKCLAEGCRRHFTNKESTCSYIQAAHSLTGLLCPWVGLDFCCPHPDCFQNWELLKKHLGSIHVAGLVMFYGYEDPEAE